ncbi:MAG: hypothetical protein AABX32_03690 [Nanoarchaeota archaeon]
MKVKIDYRPGQALPWSATYEKPGWSIVDSGLGSPASITVRSKDELSLLVKALQGLCSARSPSTGAGVLQRAQDATTSQGEIIEAEYGSNVPKEFREAIIPVLSLYNNRRLAIVSIDDHIELHSL